MLIRAMKRLLPNLETALETKATAAKAVHTEVLYGPKSLDTLKKETTDLHNKAKKAYMKAFHEGRKAAAFGNLSETLRQHDALVALNTGAWRQVAFMKTAPLKAPAYVCEPQEAAVSSVSQPVF
jgi:hypothetical protein